MGDKPDDVFERFTGYDLPGWAGPKPGGGMRGATLDLDAMVDRAAFALRDWLGCAAKAIIIRFNADCRSGGAYRKDPAHDEALGITAGLWKNEIIVRVYAGPAWLRDRSDATEGNFGDEYACPSVPGIYGAVKWLDERCLKVPVPRVPPEEVERWKHCRVYGMSVDGQTVDVSLLSAIQECGQYLDAKIYTTEDKLVEYLRSEKRMPRLDAEAVARGVFKVRLARTDGGG